MSEPHDSPKPDADDDLPPLPEPLLGSDEDGAPDFGLADEPAGERPSFLGSLETRDEPSLGAAYDEPLPTDDLPPELAAADVSFATEDGAAAGFGADDLPGDAAALTEPAPRHAPGTDLDTL